MPSIEQCDAATGGLTALPSTLEIFDKFKPLSENGKDSDSEESFHLPLDDDDIESQSVVSNGRDKEIHQEETEDDILNKFETVASSTPDNLDPNIEDRILNDGDDESCDSRTKKNLSSNKESSEVPNIQIKLTYTFDDYEDSGDGEFKSIYETECNTVKDSPKAEDYMEINEEPISVENAIIDNTNLDRVQGNECTEANMEVEEVDEPMVDAEKQPSDEPNAADVDMSESKDVTLDPKEDNISGKLIDPLENDVEMSEDVTISNENEEDGSNPNEIIFQKQDKEAKNDITLTEACSGEVEVQVPLEDEIQSQNTKNNSTVDDNIAQESSSAAGCEQVVKNDDTVDNIMQSEEKQQENVSSINELDQPEPEVENEISDVEVQIENTSSKIDVFKVPEEVLPKDVDQKSVDLCNDKSSEKAEEDESDLLDISMVRETEEDDACAIADAIEESTALEDRDKDTQASEKSDEEQSERVETEQEQEDESNDDNDNDINIGFDDLDDDSRIDSEENSNTEIVSNNFKTDVNMSESSKDSSIVNVEQTKYPNESDNVSVSTDLDIEQLQEKDANKDDDLVIIDDDNAAVIEVSDINETDKDKAKELDDAVIEVNNEEVNETVADEEKEDTDRKKPGPNKRSLSLSEADDLDLSAKKPKLTVTDQEVNTASEESIETSTETPTVKEKVQTLTDFSKFMQCRKLTAKLSRSDLEQFCIQKICESLMLKSSEGELHQAMRKHEKTIDTLRKDLQQLTKQCKDLEIVNKKLMNELRNQNGIKKPLVPLKITRSVGLQVRLNPGTEVPGQYRRSRPTATTPQKPVASSPNSAANRQKVVNGTPQQSSVVRQVLNSPQKSPLTAGQTTTSPMLTQALQKKVVAAKRYVPLQKSPAAVPKTGVIDLTNEDDRLAQAKQTAVNNTIKIINKTVSSTANPNKGPGNRNGAGSAKPLANKLAVTKTIPAGNKGNLSQGIRLTPASVITSTANGSPQMVYVVPTIANAGGQQKVAFVNFQPTNGVLSGALNPGVSVVSSKQGQTLTLKTVQSPLRHKHPAPLPTPPRINLDPKLKSLLPKPILTIKKIDTGIILQWKMPYNLDLYESIASYQLYAYQETSSPPSTDMWRKVGDVKALALPMACTLTQFADKNKYYFAVRSVDVFKRIGAFSDPEEISL